MSCQSYILIQVFTPENYILLVGGVPRWLWVNEVEAAGATWIGISLRYGSNTQSHQQVLTNWPRTLLEAHFWNLDHILNQLPQQNDGPPTILKIRSQITDNFFNQIRLHWIGSLDLMNASWIQPSNPWSRIKSRFALDQPKNYWTMLTGWKGWHGRSHSKWPPWRWLLRSSLSVYGAIWVRIRGYALSGRSRNKQKQRRLGHQTRPGCCFWWGVPIFQRVMI